MKINLKQTALMAISVFLVLCNGAELSGQLGWEFAGDVAGQTSKVFETQNADLLIATTGNSRVYRLNPNGELLWGRDICNCNDGWVVISVENPSGDLVHLTKNGQVYLTDADGLNSRFVTNITGDTSVNSRFGYIADALFKDNVIQLFGEVEIGGVDYLLRGKFDVSTLLATYELEISSDAPVSMNINDQNQRIEYLDSPGTGRIVVYGPEEEIMLDTILNIPERIADVFFGPDNLFLAGRTGDFNGSEGIVYSIGYTGEIIWSRVFYPSGFDNKIYFFGGDFIDGQIILAGSIGRGFDMDSYAVSLSPEGETLWSDRSAMFDEGNYANTVLAVSGQNNCVLIGGQGNVTDVGGRARPFLYKFMLPTVATTSSILVDAEIKIYPNPNAGTLYVDHDPGLQYDAIRLYDLNGVLIKAFSGLHSALDLRGIATGMYGLQITRGDEIVLSQWIWRN
ncbi:T9SS type A sorting domain-containing protein [Neolewinella lacunae]|uniref:T9SS type A sorting domain-containing protein n=1 Tax=Neolewinella lacunae TaxID=1517758 RepID=A0A923T9D2_9BACT|nr:T9SS type A sorting domain-containing protein [Neolewinella lacunae]MBC6996610.1 T9SS type A sorting domain-containing protein [Neolewinella lacunae]MDN3634826.1 T9SS type A sorting domain-containing protein [Neolewinella lacunae]